MTDRSLKNEAIKGGRWTGGSALAGIVVQVAQLSILSRLLNPESFGEMAIMMVIIGFANSLADFGVGNFLIQTEILTRNSFLQLIAACSIASIALSCFIFFAAPLFIDYYSLPQLIEPLRCLLIVVIMNSLGQVFGAILQRDFKFKFIAVIDIISGIFGLSISIIFALSGHGIWGLVFGQIGVSCLKAILSLWMVLPSLMNLPSGKIQDLWVVFRFGFLQTNERIFNFLSVNLDKLIIGKFLGEYALGLYSVAFQLILRPLIVINPVFNRVVYPLFAHIKNENTRLARGYLEVVRTSALMLFPVYLVLNVSSHSIASILLGAKWASIEPLLSVLSLLGLTYSLGVVQGNLLLVKGRADLALFLNIYSFTLNMLACYVGSQYSINWVAILMVAVAMIFLLPVDLYLRKILIDMSVLNYMKSIKYLFFGVLFPIVIFNIITYYFIENIISSIFFGITSVLFFIGIIKIYDCDLIKNTYKMILQK